MTSGVSLANTTRSLAEPLGMRSNHHSESLMWIVSPLILSPNTISADDCLFRGDRFFLPPELIKSCAGMLIIMSLILFKDALSSSKDIVSQLRHFNHND